MDALYLVGTFNDWEIQTKYQFKTHHHVQTLLVELPAGKTELKISTSPEASSHAFGAESGKTAVGLNQLIFLKSEGNNILLNLDHPGIYFFFLDFSEDPLHPTLRIVVKHEKLTPLEVTEQSGFGLDHFLDMKLPVTLELGRTKLRINDALSLGKGSIVELDRLVGESINVYIGGKLVALGELVVVDDEFGVQVLTVFPPQNLNTTTV